MECAALDGIRQDFESLVVSRAITQRIASAWRVFLLLGIKRCLADETITLGGIRRAMAQREMPFEQFMMICGRAWVRAARHAMETATTRSGGSLSGASNVPSGETHGPLPAADADFEAAAETQIAASSDDAVVAQPGQQEAERLSQRKRRRDADHAVGVSLADAMGDPHYVEGVIVMWRHTHRRAPSIKRLNEDRGRVVRYWPGVARYRVGLC